MTRITFGKVEAPLYGDDYCVEVFADGTCIGVLERLEGTRHWGIGTELSENIEELEGSGGYTLTEAKKAVRAALLAHYAQIGQLRLEADKSRAEALIDEGIRTGFLPADWREYTAAMQS